MNISVATISDMDKTRILAGGIAATLVITMMMYFGASMMLGSPMDIAGELAGMIGAPWMVGMAAHVALGAVVFPFSYAVIAPAFLPGSSASRGLIWGFILWLVAMFIMSPMMGKGLFMGGMPPALASLAGHLAYGLTLGLIVAMPKKDSS